MGIYRDDLDFADLNILFSRHLHRLAKMLDDRVAA